MHWLCSAECFSPYLDCKMSIQRVGPNLRETMGETYMLFILTRAGEQEVGGVNQIYF